MSRFKIGQRVVCVDDRGATQRLRQGNEYVIDGFNCCMCCGDRCVYLIGIEESGKTHCGECRTIDRGRNSYRESRFAPISEIHEAISELMKETNLITK